MREPPPIPEDDLRTCLRDQYGLSSITIEYLPRGHDYHAGVYRVVNATGAAYLLKVKHGPLYEPVCLVPAYLHDRGIAAVMAPIPTTSGVLWTMLGDWTAILYPFHDGDTRLTGMTDVQWREVGATFRRIHRAPLPPADSMPAGFASMRRETFDPAGYARWVRDFESDHLPAHQDARPAERALHATWAARRSTIHAALATLERLAAALQSRGLPLVICHGDLHAANLLRAPDGPVHVIDWDDVRLAPKERDFIFIQEPQAAAFWEGYGAPAIDWLALAYFRWERVVQDLIENAQHVCYRDDLAEATKADLSRVFDATLATDARNLAAARAASAHLPSDLTASA